MELSDKEWEMIEPVLPILPSGIRGRLGVIVEKYWKGFSGYFEREHLGGIYPLRIHLTKRAIVVSSNGLVMVH